MFEHLEGWDIFVHYQFKKFTWSTQKLVDQWSQEQVPGHARHSLYLQFLIFLTKWTANTKFLCEEFLLKYTYCSRLVHTLQCKFIQANVKQRQDPAWQAGLGHCIQSTTDKACSIYIYTVYTIAYQNENITTTNETAQLSILWNRLVWIDGVSKYYS